MSDELPERILVELALHNRVVELGTVSSEPTAWCRELAQLLRESADAFEAAIDEPGQ